MLVDGTLVVVAAAAVAAVIFTRRRSHDEVHSVEGYHRQLHTLESMGGHPVHPGGDAAPAEPTRPAYPESAVRLAGTSTVKITNGGSPPVPPVAPPPAAEPVAFDDEGTAPTSEAPPPAALSARAARRQDRAMSAMNRRPRPMAAPAAAVAGVAVLITILLVVGAHTVGPGSHRDKGTGHHTATTVTVPPAHRHRTHGHGATPSTTTTVPVVSLPSSSSAGDVVYNVAGRSYVLSLSATTGQCWLQVTDTASGATLYTGTLAAGGEHTVDATGPVTVVVGAPSALAASVDGSPVTLPAGYRNPLTMRFVTAPPAATSTSTTN